MRRNCGLKLCGLLFSFYPGRSFEHPPENVNIRWLTLSSVRFRVFNLHDRIRKVVFFFLVGGQCAGRVLSTLADTSSCSRLPPKRGPWLCGGPHTSTRGPPMMSAPRPYFRCYSPSAQQPAHWLFHQATSLRMLFSNLDSRAFQSITLLYLHLTCFTQILCEKNCTYLAMN